MYSSEKKRGFNFTLNLKKTKQTTTIYTTGVQMDIQIIYFLKLKKESKIRKINNCLQGLLWQMGTESQLKAFFCCKCCIFSWIAKPVCCKILPQNFMQGRSINFQKVCSHGKKSFHNCECSYVENLEQFINQELVENLEHQTLSAAIQEVWCIGTIWIQVIWVCKKSHTLYLTLLRYHHYISIVFGIKKT